MAANHPISLAIVLQNKVNRVLRHRWASSSDLSLARSKAICLDSANAIVSMAKRHKIALAHHRPWWVPFPLLPLSSAQLILASLPRFFLLKRPTTSALFSTALTIATEAKRLDPHAAGEHIDRFQTCFSLFEYVKYHSALDSQFLGELSIFSASLCCHDDSGTLDK